MNRDDLRAQLRVDEGERLLPYVDGVGKVTVGVGHNLTDLGISEQMSAALLEEDIDAAVQMLDANLSWWRGLDDARQGALANMAFNLGPRPGQEATHPGLLGFPHFLAALRAGRYDEAADHMLASQWARQVGPRATRLAAVVRGAGMQASAYPGSRP